MRGWLGEQGIEIPATVDLIAAGIAAGLVVAAAAVAWLVGRSAGPRLADLWGRHAGDRTEGLASRMCDMVRYLIVWVLIAIALRVYPWPPGASLILGLVAAACGALLVVNIVRGIQLPPWVAILLGGFVFVTVLSDALGGLGPIAATLDSIGFTVGDRRFTLLAVIQIAVMLLALYAVVRLLNRIVGHSIRRADSLDPAQQLLVQKLAAIAIIAAAFFIGIDLVGIDLTALAVFSGALGLAVGFGLQKTVGNLFAGIILLMDRSIKPGDVIVVGDSFGQVSKIGVRAVSVITRDGKEHLIPNEDLMTREVENWSYSSKNVRIHIPVGVSYDSDIALAQRLMIEAAVASQRVLKVPKPNVWLRGYGDSSVDHEILVWITDPEAGVGNVQSEILNRLWVLFKEHGIEIPFPQRDVHVKEWPGKA
ncbi:MAG: mechanosensitive ion channel domain-containing protein [Allosphingosinicella sp.]|uniref:mechanosensitive ion channel family protein n=1 Tax=Allosphingosinicella sp. TaxID=2823234 RepID=UPI0039287114